MLQFIRRNEETGAQSGLKVKDIVRSEKNRRVRKASRYTVSFPEQVKSLIVKQLQIKWVCSAPSFLDILHRTEALA